VAVDDEAPPDGVVLERTVVGDDVRLSLVATRELAQIATDRFAAAQRWRDARGVLNASSIRETGRSGSAHRRVPKPRARPVRARR
jgi:hypothetical protein